MLTRITGAVLATGLALLLAACGAAEEETADVASLVTETPAVVASPSAQERPLVRPDAAQEEKDRLDAVFADCMAKNGSPKHGNASEADLMAMGQDGLQAAYDAAYKACEHLEPEAPWQRAQRTDPHYADKLRDWITCVRSHGIDAFESEGFLSFESLPSEDKMKLVDECQMTAFDAA